MTINDIKKEIERRLAIIHDALIGQSPEGKRRHYTLMGKQDALKGILNFMQDEEK